MADRQKADYAKWWRQKIVIEVRAGRLRQTITDSGEPVAIH
jgi:hypothetical protein